MARLFLFDAMSLVFRAFHALSRQSFQASNGELTGAVYGFASMIGTILQKEKPEYAGIVFDRPEPTFRHKLYDQYKANRPDFPEELVPQLARIKEMIDALNIARLEMPGYEADDIIGTLCTRLASPDLEVICVTSDKDYFQLVNDRVKIYRPSSGSGADYDVIDRQGVIAKFGVPPELVIDVLALMGDSSDNVPGVKGIGEKTAIPLVQEFGTLENILASVEAIDKKAVRAKLEEHREMGLLSKHLVTIHTDVPISADLAGFARRQPSASVLAELFRTLGFRSLYSKFVSTETAEAGAGESQPEARSGDIAEEGGSAAAIDTADSVAHDYRVAATAAEVKALVASMKGASLIAFDTETTSLDTMNCDLVGISLSSAPHTGWYIPVAAFRSAASAAGGSALSLFDEPADEPAAEEHVRTDDDPGVKALLSLLEPLLGSQGPGKVGQNAKFDAVILKRHGLDVSPIVFDTMLASYVLNPDRRHGMDALSEHWLHYRPISITSLIGEKKGEQRSMAEVPLEDIAEYAAEDADVTLRLVAPLTGALDNDSIRSVAETFEFPTVEVLTAMEYAGIALDIPFMHELREEFAAEAAQLRDKVFEYTGEKFNLDSPKQLSYVLFDLLKLPSGKKTKSGYSTDSSVLEELMEYHPVAEVILEYRQMQKLLSTYVETLPKLVNPRTGRIHTTYNQTAANTGRLSSSDPNLQNIPIRTRQGRRIREAFVAQSENTVLASADYSQIELRIIAHVCGDPTLTNAFRNGEDIHIATAALMYGIPVAEVSHDQRRAAKTVNYGIAYGQGAFGLSQQLGISRGDAKKLIDTYFASYPNIKKYIDDTVQKAHEYGYVETLSGRRRYFPEIKDRNRTVKAAAERAAINMPIQGTAADMMKAAMVSVHREIEQRRLPARLLLQVHDELVVEVERSAAPELETLLKECMEGAYPLGDVPVEVEVGFGRSWGAAH